MSDAGRSHPPPPQQNKLLGKSFEDLFLGACLKDVNREHDSNKVPETEKGSYRFQVARWNPWKHGRLSCTDGCGGLKLACRQQQDMKYRK